MKTIEVKQQFTYDEGVIVRTYEDGTLIDCNHASTHNEDIDFGGVGLDRNGEMDWLDSVRPADVCDGCGAVNIEGDGWNGGELQL